MSAVGLSLVLIMTSAMGAAAQTAENTGPAISADRPGFAIAPGVLGAGLLQVESGVTLFRDGDRQERTLTLGSPLIRLGLGRSAELRVTGDGFYARNSDGVTRGSNGWSDLTVGAKFALLQERRIVPAISFLPSLSVPTGTRIFSSATYDPGLAVAALKTLPAGLSLVGTLGGTSISEERVRHGRYTSAIALWFPAPARSAAYVEMYAVISSGAASASARIYDAGFTHSVGSNLQIDIEAGRRMYSGAPCWFVAAGFAARHALFRRSRGAEQAIRK